MEGGGEAHAPPSAQQLEAGHLALGAESQGRFVFGSRQGLRDLWSLVLQHTSCFLHCKMGTWELKGNFCCFLPPPGRRAGKPMLSGGCPSLLLGFPSLNWRGSRFSGFILYLAIRNNIVRRGSEVRVWGPLGLWLQGKGRGGGALINSLSCTSVWYQQSRYLSNLRAAQMSMIEDKVPCDSSPLLPQFP